jgi:phage gpG-like protein
MALFGMDTVLDALDFESFGTARYVVGTNVEYAVYVEFGTSRNQAQPYLRPAVERAVRSMDQLSVADSPEEIAQRLALKIEAEAKREAPVDTGTLKASITAQKLS